MEHASPVEAGHGTLGEWPNTPKLDSCDGVASIGHPPDYDLMDHAEVTQHRSEFQCLFHRDRARGTRQR